MRVETPLQRWVVAYRYSQLDKLNTSVSKPSNEESTNLPCLEPHA